MSDRLLSCRPKAGKVHFKFDSSEIGRFEGAAISALTQVAT